MIGYKTMLVLTIVGVLWNFAYGLHRPPPRYSQQYMPDTSFTCRNKIVGSYYADPETDCQLFHVCVSIAGTIQDYRFLCPNDTAFDQESQTCADWYDVDCEAATLYYASDNFDLYRIGSGLESLHYDSIRNNDFEPHDNLQRSESNDPIRTPTNFNARNSKTAIASADSFVNSNNNNHNNNYNNYNNNNYNNNKNNNNNYYKGKSQDTKAANSNNNNNNDFDSEASQVKKKTGIRKLARKQQYVSSTTSPATTVTQSPPHFNQNNFHVGARLAPVQSHTTQGTTLPTSTYRPVTYRDNYNSNFQARSTTARTTVYNTDYKKPESVADNYRNHTKYSSQISIYPTTISPGFNFLQNNFSNFQSRSYNDIQRANSPSFPSTSTTLTFPNNNVGRNNNNNGDYDSKPTSKPQIDRVQTSSNFYPKTNSIAFTTTTSHPITKKLADNDQYYRNSVTDNFGSTRNYDSAKAQEKGRTRNEFDHLNSGKYYQTSTGGYDFKKSSIGAFSPSSINRLAETAKPTTPETRRPTTYSPNSFNSNPQKPTTQRITTYGNDAGKPYSTISTLADATTIATKSKKKNDYDYAYYDNGNVEYDASEVDHVTENSESSKIG